MTAAERINMGKPSQYFWNFISIVTTMSSKNEQFMYLLNFFFYIKKIS